MNKEELIEFGIKLVNKGRNASEVRGALQHKISDNDLLNEVFSKIYETTATSKNQKENPDNIKELLQANRVKLNYEYSQKGLLKIPLYLLAASVIIYIYSDTVVNRNEIFAWTTLAQSLLIYGTYAFAKYKGMMQLLLFALIGYVLIGAIELILFGIPNNLLEAYYERNVHLNNPGYRQSIGTGGSRLIGYMFPYLYIAVKCFFVVLLYNVYSKRRKYDMLPSEIRLNLK